MTSKILLLLLLGATLHADVTITFGGDVTLGEDARFSGKTFSWQYGLTQDSSWFTEGIRPFFSSDDLTVVNLEGVISDEALEPTEKKYRFIGPSKNLNILKTGSIELVNLANNHAPYDFGTIGLQQTRKNLSLYGINSYGYKDVFQKIINGKKVCICGNEAFSTNTLSKVDRNIKTLRSTCDILVYTFHWGVEREYKPNDFQIELAHHVIDAGADLVVGHHPHVVQTVEYYKGKPIIYSLGNLIFGGNNNPGDKEAILYQITFTDNGYTDKIIPINISSVSYRNDFRPTLRKP